MNRPDGRQPDQLREISFTPDFAPNSTGSVLCSFGNTRVICAATVEEDVPRWMKHQGVKGGWVTAEYSMLPYSTHQRKQRDVIRGKQDGRSMEIQRLIGRALRSTIDLKELGHRTIWVDCDVLQADGGTRTASITGGAVALGIALNKLIAEGKLLKNPMKKLISAVSCGVYEGVPVLDLNYPEDRDASVDFNLVMTEENEFVEVQGSGEESTYTEAEMNAMIALGKKGISELTKLQKDAIAQSSKGGAKMPDFSGNGAKLEL